MNESKWGLPTVVKKGILRKRKVSEPLCYRITCTFTLVNEHGAIVKRCKPLQYTVLCIISACRLPGALPLTMETGSAQSRVSQAWKTATERGYDERMSLFFFNLMNISHETCLPLNKELYTADVL